jgi:aerobic carbon-monoxide dehydrogenase small subunit
MDTAISLIVNSKQHTVTTDPQRPLLDVLREELQLTGTKYGCGERECGACSVLLDGKRAFSCMTDVAKASGKAVQTVEGLADGDTLHPIQQAFLDEHAFQCGYCTAGMMMAAVALLDRNPHPSDGEIVAGMNNNLCRCNGYPAILKAVQRCAASGGK